jgi:hypothetical protein
MTLYNIRSALDDFRITKFTPDLDVESSYLLSDTVDEAGRRQLLCECPAGVRPSCRHRQMLPHLLPLVDTEYFWDFERSLAVDADGNQRFTVVPEAESPLTPANDAPANIPPAKSAEGVGHHSEARAARPAFGSDLPPGVRLPNQKGNWRRI